MLFRIALSNFVIPTLFSIAQLVIVYRNVNVVVINDIVLVNGMLAVFGVVFATVWVGKTGRHEAKIDLWDDASRMDDAAAEKRPAREYAFPGLGTWRVASAPQTVTFGSARYTGPTGSPGLSAFDGIGTDNRNNRGMSCFEMGFASVVSVSLTDLALVDVLVISGVSKDDTTKSSGHSTQGY